MKTKMSKANLAKEAPPRLTREAWHIIRPPSLAESYKEWRELGGHRELSQSILLAFGAETNNAPGKINLAGNVHVRFGKATALFPSDLVANEHPLWLMVECGQYGRVFRVRNAWLLNRRRAPYAELMTRVVAGKVVVNGFLGYKTQKLNLQEGSILPRSVNAFMGRLSSPSNIGANMLPRKCAGYANVILAQKRAQVAPRSLIAFQRILLGLVSLLQKLRNPQVPLLMLLAYVALGCAHLAAKVARPPAVGWYGVLEAGRLSSPPPGGVEEANPEVGGVGPAVQRSHWANVVRRSTPSKENQPKDSLS